MTLAELPDAYHAARETASNAARHTAGATPRNTCRYCGKFWKPFAGTRADGHAKCNTTLAFQRAVYELWRRDLALSRDRIGEICGVSYSVVSAWIAHVKRIGRAA